MKTHRPLLLATLAALPFCHTATTARGAVDFVKDIVPIFQQRCIECHGAEKVKGKLRMDTRADIFKGGDTGPSIVAGQADKSELYRRITLPKDHDEVMPNKGELLTKAQTDLIRNWINEGAKWPDGFVIAPAGAVAAGAKPKSRLETPAPKPSPAELQAVAELAKLGIDAREIAANVNWRYANFRVAGQNVDPKAFAALKKINNLAELNLSTVKLKDADLANLAGLTNLVTLNLSGTPVTDAGLVHLKGLVHLTSLNLFNTAVTDAGLKHLEGLKELRSLYLFETKTTDAGVAALQKALPNTRIDRGWDLKELAKIEASIKAAEKAAEEKKAAEKKAEAPKADAKKDAAKKPAAAKKKAEKKN
jgi:mono/diheme cytochrome c family protein